MSRIAVDKDLSEESLCMDRANNHASQSARTSL